MRSIGRNLAATAVFLAMLLAAFSLWTLIPLGWVYIASKLAHSQFPSIGPYMVVIVGIILTVLADAWLIGRLNDLYVRVTGTNRLVASRPGWMKNCGPPWVLVRCKRPLLRETCIAVKDSHII